ncbi:Hvo_1808 family surface protein [Halapricum hydrolyticum]|uniref:Hvo_1808 family surface protein n=1 Tax=Halapricum hydrolyticum TaxID=2979991 RepID=A0AAE3LK63_9EURY|nr:Hvo_1808 family surface protein [Halapricum hydrolyticum]MCU4719069.1 Hvo_1808 family surface protein [Halapricum hydrolyticum]MCU4728058.1 Hvo_1808 family surface protein [Halapricum hydrolyticum]
MGVSRFGLILLVGLVVAGATVGSATFVGSETGVSLSEQPGNSGANATATVSSDTLLDPPEDRIGWEGGYWYNESIEVDQSDGLSESELQRYKYRTMARLEKIRGLEFTDDVEIEFIGPDEVADRIDGNVTQFRGTDQQWEALFVVGEDREADRVVFETLVGSVVGWAAEEGSETVVLITDDPGEPTAPPTLMAHELAHELQHQQFDLDADRYQRATLDGENAKDALVEGEASHLDSVYDQHCTNGSWDCVDRGSFATGRSNFVEFGLLPYLRAPYTLGSEYVGRLIDRGGFDAVDGAHRNPPEYSVTALHGEETEPVRQTGIAPASPLSVPDRSDDNWTRQAAPDRVGAMGLSVTIGDAALAWRNGALYPYTNGSADGYVWETHWSNETTAAAFADAYRGQLSSEGGTQITDRVWEIQTGTFADAFAVNQTGNAVRIVNAPSVEALSAVHGDSEPDTRESETPTTPATRDATTDPARTTSSGTTADGDGPGFGIAAALIALIAATSAKRKRSSGRDR